MRNAVSRRSFLRSSVVGAALPLSYWAGAEEQKPDIGRLALNDDGHVFLYMSDDLHKDDLRRYLESYCKPGVNAVAFCVGDMSWPTFYPTKVGVHYSAMSPGNDLKKVRAWKNLDNFASEPGGFHGETFRILHELGKTTLASFRMNDAHFTTPDNPDVSEFWKKHADLALGSVYGYYGGCLNYASDVVRDHFYQRVVEFMELYPDIDGLELDAMRSPYFFLPDKGKEQAPLFTELVKRIKQALADQAKRLNRPDYLLTINVPITPELCLESGLDVAAWDAEKLFDCVSVGTYQANMDLPMEQWQKLLVNNNPVFAYINCSPQSGRYLDLEEYRAAAMNAYGAGADGIYLFNYPCLLELAMQLPSDATQVPMALPDLRTNGQSDFSTVAQALDELGDPEKLRNKNKRYLFAYSEGSGYRHFVPVGPSIDRVTQGAELKTTIRCYDDYERAHSLVLKFKIENVFRTERFSIMLNDKPIDDAALTIQSAAGGRDTRMHTITLGPYLEYELALKPQDLISGENTLTVTPKELTPNFSGTINLREISLQIFF